MVQINEKCRIKDGSTSFDLPEHWSNIVTLVEVKDDGSCRVCHTQNMGCYSWGLLKDLEEIDLQVGKEA